MSRIDELIRELCPEGVPRKVLRDCGSFKKGGSLQKKDMMEIGKPAIHYGQIHMNPVISLAAPPTRVSDEIFSTSRKADPGDLIIADTSEDLDGVATALAWLGESQIAVSGHILVFSHNLEPKYVSYFFKTADFRSQKNRKSKGVKVKDISSERLGEIAIPVPPLEIQREIVSILDKFTQLEAELEAELEARRTQYEVTRDRLLDFSGDLSSHPMGEVLRQLCPDGVQKLSLGELVRIRNGKDHKHLGQGEVPVYGSGGIMRYADARISLGPTVLIPRKGSLGNLFYVEGPFWVVDTIFFTEIDESVILARFLFHKLQTMGLGEMNQAGGVPSQTQSALNRLEIEVPPLEVQREIVSILDKLDTLVNDITFGLPAEIEARRKQYEYYRNKLLTFKELDAA